MKKSTKLWLIVALILFLSGGAIFVATLWVNDWDFNSISTENYQTKTFDITDDFNSVSICDSEADIVFLKSKDNTARVVCYQNQKEKHAVQVVDSVLKINYTKAKNWYERITIMSLDTPKITVYLPKEDYLSLTVETNTGDVEIPKDFRFKDIKIDGSTCDVNCFASAENSLSVTVSTGDIKIKDITTKNLNLLVSTGDITLDGVNCKTLNSNGSTGDMVLKKVIAENKLKIKRNTGDISLYGCDAGEISIKTSTGDVSGSLLTDKVFVANSNTGNITVPKTTTGGICEITTDTGYINLKIA